MSSAQHHHASSQTHAGVCPTLSHHHATLASPLPPLTPTPRLVMGALHTEMGLGISVGHESAQVLMGEGTCQHCVSKLKSGYMLLP